MKFVSKYKSHILVFIISGILFSSLGVYAATTLASSSVSYDNTTSGGGSTNVQGAVDDLYDKTKYGNATATDIASGKTALVGGKKITGTGGTNSNTPIVSFLHDVSNSKPYWGDKTYEADFDADLVIYSYPHDSGKLTVNGSATTETKRGFAFGNFGSWAFNVKKGDVLLGTNLYYGTMFTVIQNIPNAKVDVLKAGNGKGSSITLEKNYKLVIAYSRQQDLYFKNISDFRQQQYYFGAGDGYNYQGITVLSNAKSGEELNVNFLDNTGVSNFMLGIYN